MKKYALIIFAALALAVAAIVGTWSGAAKAGGGQNIPMPPSQAQIQAAQQGGGAGPFVLCGPSGCGGGGGGGTCSDVPPNDYKYAGYFHSSLPAIGSSASANVMDEFHYLYSGHTAGWVGVDLESNGTPIKWIQAGLSAFPSGSSGVQEAYIEYNLGDGTGPHYIPAGAISSGTNYTATITHVANGQWKGTINGHSYTANINPSGGVTFTSETWNSTTNTCNTLEYQFTSVSYTTASMGPPFENNPYWTDTTGLGTNGWVSVGP